MRGKKREGAQKRSEVSKGGARGGPREGWREEEERRNEVSRKKRGESGGEWKEKAMVRRMLKCRRRNTTFQLSPQPAVSWVLQKDLHKPLEHSFLSAVHHCFKDEVTTVHL